MEQVVGFNNTGVICWFNSLLQCLLSSHYFVKIIMLTHSDNLIIKSLQDLIKSINERPQEVHNSSIILKSLLVILKDKDSNRFREFAMGQQSASEGFTLLLDYIDNNSLSALFTHRYEERVVWEKNLNKIESKIIGNNNQFMIFDENELKKSGLSEYIKYHEHPLDEYKSENPDTDPETKFKRLYVLRYLPKVVVMLLNRYYKRNRDISLPEEFKIPSCQFDGFMLYKKIAEIDHMGSLNGGHYISKIIRNNKAYMCNDSTYVPYRLETTSNTYMTFYEYSKNIYNKNDII